MQEDAGKARDRAIVAGEALMDLVVAPSGAVEAHPGGGPCNVARTMARLGDPPLLLARISRDGFGARLRRHLDADRVPLDCVVATDDPTTLAIADLDEDGVARYGFYLDGTSAAGLTEDEARATMPDRVDTLVVGGLSLVADPVARTLERIVLGLGPDTLVALDPNCRPDAIADPAEHRARIVRIAARTDVLKASEEDLAFLRPGTDPVGAIRGLLAPGGLGLITLGPRGAIAVVGSEIAEVAAPPTDVVDTIGAGDAFMGAFLSRWRAAGLGRGDLDRRDAVVDAAGFACRVAAITCSRAGADPPRADDLGR